MKLPRTIFAIILLSPCVHLFSQSISDFIVIDEIADNITELQAEFNDQPNVLWTDRDSPDAIRQITDFIEGLQIENLHIYVPTKPGAIVFSSIAITPDDVADLAVELHAWSNAITKQVVIHSETVFTGEEGLLLKQRLEEATGLLFTTLN